MAGEPQEPSNSAEDTVLEQQYLRALSSFEGIVLSQIDVKNALGDRLNYSIRAGLIILSVIAFSILILLLTLSSQINRISSVVGAMNTHFSAITLRMGEITENLASMEVQVAQLQSIEQSTATMRIEMEQISADMTTIQASVLNIGGHMAGARQNVENISLTMGAMNAEVQGMGAEMHRMATPARTMNNIFPFP